MKTFTSSVARADLAEITNLVEACLVRVPHNPDGSIREQLILNPEESVAIVTMVLSELGRLGYVVMKPEVGIRGAFQPSA